MYNRNVTKIGVIEINNWQCSCGIRKLDGIRNDDFTTKKKYKLT